MDDAFAVAFLGSLLDEDSEPIVEADDPVNRPIVRWYGGKWHVVPWIMSHMPPHRAYVEPYGGGASLLMRKRRSRVEVINDLDARVHALYLCLREEALATRLKRGLELTPYSRRELDLACTPVEGLEGDDLIVETARRLVVRGGLGFSGDSSSTRSTGFRDYTRSQARGTLPVDDWLTYPDAIDGFVARMRGVVIDSRDGCEVMQRHDRADTLHYVDPPYHMPTRRAQDRGYKHDMVDADQTRLLECLIGLTGMVMLSGYRCDLYDKTLVGWHRVDRKFVTQGKTKATESLWVNPAAQEALDTTGERQGSIFDVLHGPIVTNGDTIAFRL